MMMKTSIKRKAINGKWERERSMLTVLVMVNMKTYGMEGTNETTKKKSFVVWEFSSLLFFLGLLFALLYTLVSLIWFGFLFLLLQEVFEILCKVKRIVRGKEKGRNARWDDPIKYHQRKPNLRFPSFHFSVLIYACTIYLSLIQEVWGTENNQLFNLALRQNGIPYVASVLTITTSTIISGPLLLWLVMVVAEFTKDVVYVLCVCVQFSSSHYIQTTMHKVSNFSWLILF